MNKKILTVAIAAALAAPASVLAEVTVYGQLHMSMDYTDTNTSVAPTSATNTAAAGKKSNLGLSSNSSRIGFKGSEDLGGGLQAIWQVESQVNLDTGSSVGTSTATNAATGTLANRDTFLGLAGNFGTALFGKHDTPFKMFGRSLDPFADTIADTRQLLGNMGSLPTSLTKSAGTVALTDPGFDLRPGNVMAYITPSFAGVQGAIAYVTGTQPTSYTDGVTGATGIGGADNNKLNAISLDVTYTNGPIYGGFAYERHNIKDLTGVSDQAVAGADVPGAKDPSAWRLGGSYTYGPAKVGAMWEQIKAADLIDEKRSGATVFGTYAIGAETVKLAYTEVGSWKGTATTTAGSPDTKADVIALGVDHNFSKRTTDYAQYTKMTNKGNTTTGGASYSLGGGGGYGNPVTPGVSADPSAFSVGLIHKF